MKNCHRTLLILATASVWLATIVNPANAQTDPIREWKVSKNLTIRQVRPGVWVHTSWRKLDNGIDFPSNGLLVRNKGELVLIDTAWGTDITKELLEWIDSEIRLPVAIAIVTHFHDDSMGGAPVLAARGIRFVGLPLTRALGKNAEGPLPESIGDLQVGDVVSVANVEVFYPGPGHSKDNLVVWVPEAEVLFGSCAVRSPAFPGTGNTADADLAGWPEAIGRVQKRYPNAKIVVPGHGPPGDASLLSHTIRLFKH